MLMALVALPLTTAHAQEYRSYANARYGYAICYPASFRARPEAPDGDGRTFVSPDGGRLTVFGRNNPDNDTLAQTARVDAQDLAGASGQITYRVQRANWAVYSGSAGATDFHSKTFARRDSFAVFELSYPRAAAARYRQVAARLSRCFRLLG